VQRNHPAIQFFKIGQYVDCIKKFAGTFQNKFPRCRKSKPAHKDKTTFSNNHTVFHAHASFNPPYERGNHSKRMGQTFYVHETYPAFYGTTCRFASADKAVMIAR
jgi:hypothetical protein